MYVLLGSALKLVW